ncbi:MAG: hypothetical protein ACTHMG_01080 [Sphingomonas sp.]
MTRRVLPLALLLLAGCAGNSGAPHNPDALTAKEAGEIADTLKDLTPGKPQSCIDQSRIRDVQKYTDTILYVYSRREIYRNTPTPGCSGLRYGDIIVSRTTSDQLCRGDIIHTVAPGGSGPTGSCALGDFVPYRK